MLAANHTCQVPSRRMFERITQIGILILEFAIACACIWLPGLQHSNIVRSMYTTL